MPLSHFALQLESIQYNNISTMISLLLSKFKGGFTSLLTGNGGLTQLSKGFYFLGIVFIIFGLSYLAVPLYRLYCQITGYGGTIKAGPGTFIIGETTTTGPLPSIDGSMGPQRTNIEEGFNPKDTSLSGSGETTDMGHLIREITIRFNADLNENLPWKFRPAANEIKIIVGEGAAPTLTFYSLTNLSDQPATGVATYNVTPAKAAIYFNKIQCFCLSAIVA